MKQAFSILLLIAVLMVGVITYELRIPLNPSSEQQTADLQPVMWKVQKQFGLNKFYFTLQVRRVWEMEDCHCWGRSDFNTSTIQILDIRDMPRSMPWRERQKFQHQVLQHELMHFVLEALEVPAQAQDSIIETLRPALVQP